MSAATASAGTNARPLTIGAVCARLQEEFPDISISKIRYLEDQGLLHPQRTQGGYRLFRDEDVQRLQTILRLQRDEFLPLRVIREELTAPARARRDRRKSQAKSALRSRLQAPLVEFDELCEQAGADPAFVRQLEDAELVRPTADGRYPQTDAAIVEVCTRLLRFGVEPRNLNLFRRAAANQGDLVTKVVAADLRAASPERRERGLEELERLAQDAAELSQLLFWQALRRDVERR